MTTATQRKMSKKQAKFILHEAKAKAGEIYQEQRRGIENEFNIGIRPLLNIRNERRAIVKQECREKLKPIDAKFEVDAQPIFDLRETRNIQAKTEYKQNVEKIKSEYLERKAGK
jgi:hypothetical protein